MDYDLRRRRGELGELWRGHGSIIGFAGAAYYLAASFEKENAATSKSKFTKFTEFILLEKQDHLLVTQGHHGIDFCRAPRGDVAGQ